MVSWFGTVVHAEGSVYVADVGNVVNLLEGLADELSRSMITLPHVGTYVHSMPNKKFESERAKT